jgi:hypothetical protein
MANVNSRIVFVFMVNVLLDDSKVVYFSKMVGAQLALSQKRLLLTVEA